MAKSGEFTRASDTLALTYVVEPADSALITNVETVVGTVVFTAVAGIQYMTEWHLKMLQSVAADFFIVNFREDNLTGASIDAFGFSMGNATYGDQRHWFQPWTASSNATKTIVATMVRTSGTGNIKRYAKSNYAVRKMS